jgi:hypothetical protein
MFLLSRSNGSLLDAIHRALIVSREIKAHFKHLWDDPTDYGASEFFLAHALAKYQNMRKNGFPRQSR